MLTIHLHQAGSMPSKYEIELDKLGLCFRWKVPSEEEETESRASASLAEKGVASIGYTFIINV